MTDDRALLEAAARAAGISTVINDHLCVRDPLMPSGWRIWNPLDDDAQALRLAVKLGLVIYMPDDDDKTVVVRTSLLGSAPRFMEESKRADPYAATHRAIVRAAAGGGEDGGVRVTGCPR